MVGTMAGTRCDNRHVDQDACLHVTWHQTADNQDNQLVTWLEWQSSGSTATFGYQIRHVVRLVLVIGHGPLECGPSRGVLRVDTSPFVSLSGNALLSMWIRFDGLDKPTGSQ